MVSLIKEQIKKHRDIYHYLRYKKSQVYHNLSNLAKAEDCVGRVKAILENIDLNPRPKKENVPTGSSIEITNACNLNCLMCNTKLSKRQIGFIDPGIFEKVIQQLQGIGIQRICLHTVGETFMYENIKELLGILKKYDFYLWLSSNGQFPKRIEEACRDFRETINELRFSIDGAIRGTYEYIRKGASFDKLFDSLNVIHKINGGKRDYRIILTIDSILSMTNISEIQLFFKVFGKYCWPEHINFHIVDSLSPDPAFFNKEFNFPHLVRSKVPCELPFRSIYFTYGGKATLCCRDYNEDLVVGDIKKSSILELWNSPRAEKIRQMQSNPGAIDIKACQNCNGPHEFVSTIVNEYIHYLFFRYPELSPEQFRDKIMFLLNGMNDALGSKDIKAFSKFTLQAF